MNFLADECVDMRLVRRLRDAGLDILSILETNPSIPDPDVLARAVETGRILITQDKDFGPLLTATHSGVAGAFLLRSVRVPRCAEAILDHLDAVRGHLIVITNDRVRLRPLPPSRKPSP